MYIDKLDDIINNNTYHKAIKIKPVDVKSSKYIDSSKEINNKDPKFKVEDIVRISKYKTIFAKGYVPNWFEEVFGIKKTLIETLCRGHKLLAILTEKELLERFTKKTSKKQFKKSLQLKK